MKATISTQPGARPTLSIASTLSPGGAYETNLHNVMGDHCREEYLALYTLLQEIHRASIEGVTELTLRTRTRSITVTLMGELGEKMSGMLDEGLGDMLGVRLDVLERNIIKHEQDAAEDVGDLTGDSTRAQTFAFCLPMRPMSDAEFEAMPPEARRAYDEHRAENLGQPVKGGLAA